MRLVTRKVILVGKEKIHSKVIHANGYWRYPEKPKNDPCLSGVWIPKVNAVNPDNVVYCDYAGNLPPRASLCKVYKGEAYLVPRAPEGSELTGNV